MEQGLIQIYTGDGKGKTTAAFGLVLRALGQEKKVGIIQFLKARKTGEVAALQAAFPELEILRFHSGPKFIFKMNEEEKKEAARKLEKGWQMTRNIITGSDFDLLILDELLGLVKTGFIDLQEVKKTLLEKPDTLEVVLTGRDAPPELTEIAALVTEMRKIKHPFDQKIPARRGIEY